MRLYNIDGTGKSNSKMYTKLHNVWYKMHQRCSNTEDKDYCRYGELGITIDLRWRNFLNFVKDVQKIDGWSRENFMNSKIQLDKDKLQIDIPKDKQIYSFDTCLWLTPYENKQIQTAQQDKFIALSPDNDIYFGRNKYQFCKKHNLHEGNFWNALNDKTSSYCGWLVKYVKDGWDKDNMLKYKHNNFDIVYSDKNNLKEYTYWVCNNKGSIFQIGNTNRFCQANNLPISVFKNGVGGNGDNGNNNNVRWYTHKNTITLKGFINYIRLNKKPKYMAISPSKTKHYFNNVSKFMKNTNVNRNAVYNVINGNRPDVKGWVFYKYDNFVNNNIKKP